MASRVPCTAAMVPGTALALAWAMAAPRMAESLRQSSRLMAPAAASATYSP